MTTSRALRSADTVTNEDARMKRIRAKVLQREVAEEIGISREAYAAWERGASALAWGRTPLEVMDAITAIAERKQQGQQDR